MAVPFRRVGYLIGRAKKDVNALSVEALECWEEALIRLEDKPAPNALTTDPRLTDPGMPLLRYVHPCSSSVLLVDYHYFELQQALWVIKIQEAVEL